MAELLGVVASGISVFQLAGQVAKSAVKFKDYWDQVKEAPAEISYLLREIESLNLILGHIKDDQSQQIAGIGAGNICIQQSLELCRQGADELSGLVNELAEKVEGKGKWRSRVGSAKVVLKKEDIKRLKKRMKNAIGLLSLAYQFHTNAMIQLQPEIIVARVTSHMSSLMTSNTAIIEPQSSQNESSDQTFQSDNLVTRQYQCWTSSYLWTRYLLGHLEYAQQVTKYKRKERKECVARYVAPSWTPNRNVFQVQGYSTFDGLQISLKTYRIVPDDSPIFKAVGAGDLEGVQILLASKEAFVTDRTRDEEETPLHMAAFYSNLEMCKLLLSAGANPLASDRYNWTPVHMLAVGRSYERRSTSFSFMEITNLLFNAGADDALIGECRVLSLSGGSLAEFQCLRGELFPPGIAMSPRDRSEVARRFLGKSYTTPLLIRYIISSQDQVDLDVITQFEEDCWTLFHTIAGGVADPTDYKKELLYDYLNMSSENLNEFKKQGNNGFMWRGLLRDCLSAGAVGTLGQLDRDGRSPLRNLISDAAKKGFENLNIALTNWLLDLKVSGIDLIKYGATERENVLQFSSVYEYCSPLLIGKAGSWCHDLCYYEPRCPLKTRLISISYGPNPQDWILWFDEWTDEFAGEFWAGIEDLESGMLLNKMESVQIPGSWVEHDIE